MSKTKLITGSWSMERKALIAFSIIFVGVIITAWMYAMDLRRTVIANNSIVTVDPDAVVEVERIRNLAESQISNSRSFFLLGSKALFDKQKAEKQDLVEALTKFEANYSLPEVPDLIKHLNAVEQQHQDIFDQAMDYREKQTESKIVGQFYQSKTAPIRTQINDTLDAITRFHKVALERERLQAKQASVGIESQIPKGMLWFTGAVSALFFGMALLVIRMLTQRLGHIAERNRLYNEAKAAVQARDEVISAVAQDLNEPLSEINALADAMASYPEAEKFTEGLDLIKSSVTGVEQTIKDIYDQKNADMGQLTLRLDQLSVDDFLDDTRVALQPLAKQRDVRLQFDSVNPPVLAFFDRERITRVLSNIVGNAIKFSPKHSKVVVKVRSDQQFVNISVADSGPGIPEKQRGEIFDSYWQARKTADQGPGVGLAVVKTIVEAHGGSVRVDKNSDNGSTFTFSLPRRRPVGAHIKKPTTSVRYSKPKADFFEGPIR